MTRSEFLRHLETVLERDPDTLTGAERLEDLEEWDSLAVIGFIAMVDERLGVVVEGAALAQARAVNDLVDLAGVTA